MHRCTYTRRARSDRARRRRLPPATRSAIAGAVTSDDGDRDGIGRREFAVIHGQREDVRAEWQRHRRDLPGGREPGVTHPGVAQWLELTVVTRGAAVQRGEAGEWDHLIGAGISDGRLVRRWTAAQTETVFESSVTAAVERQHTPGHAGAGHHRDARERPGWSRRTACPRRASRRCRPARRRSPRCTSTPASTTTTAALPAVVSVQPIWNIHGPAPVRDSVPVSWADVSKQ